MTLFLLLLWTIPLTAMQVDPSVAIDQSMPWPVQLGLNGVTLGALIAFFVWQNKQVSNGRWYPEPIVDRMLAEKDLTIEGLTTQLAGQVLLADEQRKTIRANESTADTMAKALVQATSNQGWVDVLVQRAIGAPAAPIGSTLEPKPSKDSTSTKGVPK